jgi:hypothetical protein
VTGIGRAVLGGALAGIGRWLIARAEEAAREDLRKELTGEMVEAWRRLFQ